MKKIVFFSLACAVIFVLGYSVLNRTLKTKDAGNMQTISVVTTLFPLYDFVRAIGGDRVSVYSLLPPGAEVHAFEPKPSDIVKINNADLFVYAGKFMEPWAEDIINSVTNKNVKFVNTSNGIGLMKLTEGMPDEAHGFDPHIWLDFDNASKMAESIERGLELVDAEHIYFYRENLERYKQELRNLDDAYKNTLRNCKTKTIVYGGHYAFGYLASRYGLEYVAAQGVAPDAEPSARDLANLADQIRRENIHAIFYEELSSPKIAQVIAQETQARMYLLNAAHNVSKEDMINDVSFLSIMRENLNNLRTGLECTP